MNSGSGKAQREMHPTNIKQEVGYFGPHEKIIEIGDQKHIIFQEGGYVTFWMNPQEFIDTKFSQYDDPQLKDKTKADSISNIKSAGVDISVVKGKKVGNLQDVSRKNSFYVTKIKLK